MKEVKKLLHNNDTFVLLAHYLRKKAYLQFSCDTKGYHVIYIDNKEVTTKLYDLFIRLREYHNTSMEAFEVIMFIRQLEDYNITLKLYKKDMKKRRIE